VLAEELLEHGLGILPGNGKSAILQTRWVSVYFKHALWNFCYPIPGYPYTISQAGCLLIFPGPAFVDFHDWLLLEANNSMREGASLNPTTALAERASEIFMSGSPLSIT
jgi:hypothetical protein